MSIRLKAVLKLVLLVVLFLFILSLCRNLWGLWHAGGRLGKAEEKVKELEAKNAKLLEEKERFESGQFLEEQARNKLFMAKKDELVLILPGLATLGKEEGLEEEGLEAEEKEVWQKWLEFFW